MILVFLEKSLLRHERNSLKIELFGIPSMWRSQNDILQQKYFRSNFVFSDPGKLGEQKELSPKQLEKAIIYHYA